MLVLLNSRRPDTARFAQAGATVKYIVKENEGHGLANLESNFEFNGAMKKLLEKNLKKPIPERMKMQLSHNQ